MKLLWCVQATEVAEGDSLIAEDVTLLSVVPDQGPSQFDILSQRELEERFKDLLSTLTPREERILRMRFGVGLDHDRTLQSIGDEYIAIHPAGASKKTRRMRLDDHMDNFRDTVIELSNQLSQQWDEWQRVYKPGSTSSKLLEHIRKNYWLVNIIDHGFLEEGALWNRLLSG